MMPNVFVNRKESTLSLERVKSICLCAEEAAGIMRGQPQELRLGGAFKED